MKGFTTLREVIANWSPGRQAPVTGISAEILGELASAHRDADGAALCMATGVNQGRNRTLYF